MVTNQRILKAPPIETQLGELIDKFEQAPYPDSGVRYDGYYKTLLAGNRFEVKKQNPVSFAKDFGAIDFQFTTKRTYITSISVLAAGITGTGTIGNSWSLRNGSSSGTVIFDAILRDGDSEFSATFPTPLQFPDGCYADMPSVAGVTDGDFTINVSGFTEDI